MWSLNFQITQTQRQSHVIIKKKHKQIYIYQTFYLSCFRGNVLRLNLGLAEGEERGLGESRGLIEEMNTELETPQEASTLQYHIRQLDKVCCYSEHCDRKTLVPFQIVNLKFTYQGSSLSIKTMVCFSTNTN